MWNLCYKSKILESMHNSRKNACCANLTIQFWNAKVKFERTLPSLQVNLFFPLHDIVVLNNEYGADVGRNSTPRVSSRPFSWHSSIYLFLQINWIRGYNPDISEITFFSCWDPCVHRESNKMAPIAEKWFR